MQSCRTSSRRVAGPAKAFSKIAESALLDGRLDNWPTTWNLVRELMPNAVMFSDAGPDFRWVGNKRGIAGDPCWATLNAAGRYPGGTSQGLNSGERPGTDWIPAECDVSIRPGWFCHEKENSRVKSAAELTRIYFNSVGRGACLNLNVPPDTMGCIHENDVRSLREFGRWLRATFATDLARTARFSASNTRGHAKQFQPENVADGDRTSYWATDDAVTDPALTLDFAEPVRFNVVSLREYLPLGQRVEGFALDRWKNGDWEEFAKGTNIGNRRLLRIDPITANRIRLRITRAPVCPAIAEVGIFAEATTE